MRVFLLTGEPSGDLHGAHLAAALRALAPDVALTGVGGARMREAGVDLIAHSEHWGAIGIPDALRKIPGLLYQKGRILRHVAANPPDVLVAIDFGAFNVRLLDDFRRLGLRTLYFIPPGSWSRTRKAGRLPFLVDAIATPFPWSAENLRAAGGPARVEWVGHPLLEYCRVNTTRAQARAALEVAEDRPVIALVPGSRRKELRYLLPVFLAALRLITPRPLGLLAVAPSLDERAIRRRIPDDLEVRLLQGLDYDALQAADGALAASGTATLELAILGIPMVVAYRGSLADELQWQFIKRAITSIALPNILTESTVVPELLQRHASPYHLATTLVPLLTDSVPRRAQLAAFADIRTHLGDGHAIQRTAEMVLAVGRGATPANTHGGKPTVLPRNKAL